MLVRDKKNRRITLGDVADTLEHVASTQGGSHRDVEAFMTAEFGPLLEKRRERLAELLEHPTVLAGTQHTHNC